MADDFPTSLDNKPLSSSGNPPRKGRGVTAQDEAIMGTNDSSIVSKRSVERLYLPEPHMLRHFVKKPKRRAPLVNRGYWLRMKTIEYEVKSFLKESASSTKVLVNLGCGHDALSFSLLAKAPELTTDVLFIDVDYPSLIRDKVAMMQASPEIMRTVGDAKQAPHVNVFLQSKRYIAMGCDLSQPERLEMVLRSVLNLDQVSLCFLAEVSIAYMKESDANQLIRWASGLPKARFILHEQCAPWGLVHPFASTMMSYYTKLGTPLRSLESYTTLEDQQQRFIHLGWTNARARSLWEQWSDLSFLNAEERANLNAVEPFDEWEDFALSCRHYFTLVATNDEFQEGTVQDTRVIQASNVKETFTKAKLPVLEIKAAGTRLPPRSHGVLFKGHYDMICHHGGYSTQKRLINSELYSKNSAHYSTWTEYPPASIGERVGHTITRVGLSNYHLLVGGRSSPDRAFSSCWLQKYGIWVPAEPLPFGLYRHCALSLPRSRAMSEKVKIGQRVDSILVYGGKSGSTDVSKEWLLWTGEHGTRGEQDARMSWLKLKAVGHCFEPLFGASISLTTDGSDGDHPSGLLVGGMTADGIVNNQTYSWTIDFESQTVSIKACADGDNLLQLGRFGAQLVQSSASKSNPSRCLLVGGITGAVEHPRDYKPILSIEREQDGQQTTYAVRPVLDEQSEEVFEKQGPLLVGHSALLVEDEANEQAANLVIVGGGATCFPLGSCFNKGLWVIRHGKLQEFPMYSLLNEHSLSSATPSKQNGSDKKAVKHGETVQVDISVDSLSLRDCVKDGRPRILRGLDIGSCTANWNCGYLKGKMGSDKEVTIHSSEGEMMDFQKKNFKYKKVPFGEFLDSIQFGGKHYLRALSSESINKPADFWSDYPELASDFKLPPQLTEYVHERAQEGQHRMHSSVLRISGPVAMWLHYDVMANVLCQVSGSKRLLLFPPSDVTLLEVAPGQSSSSLDMFDADTYIKFPQLEGCHAHEALLQAGDVLFIPALWLHTAQPTEGSSMAVNVFFRDLDNGYAAGRDVYGNRDLHAYEEGRKQIQKLKSRFDGLPASTREFYISRLAKELQSMAAGL